MAEWQNGRMVEWQNGGMAEWHNVRYKIVRNQHTESTQMPPWQSPSLLVLVYENLTVFIPSYESPPQYSSHNNSRLHCLITLAQIAEGKNLVEPAEISIEEEDELYF